MRVSKIKDIFFKGNERSSIVKKNILASLGIKSVSIFVSFALVPLTIGYVSSDLYGVWLTLSSILTWIGFLDLGFSQGLKNRLTESIAVGDWIKGKMLVSTTYFLMIILMIPACIILECLIPLINWSSLLNVSVQYEEQIRNVMYILIAFAGIQIILGVLTSVVAAFQMVAFSNSFYVIGNVLSLIIIFVFSKTIPPSLLALVFSLGAMPLLVLFFSSILLYNSKFRRVSPNIHYVKIKYARDLFNLGYKFFIINIQVVILYQSTNILISNVSSPNEVTVYNIAYKLLSSAMMFYSIISGPLWPAYTDAYVKKDYTWMEKVHSKMLRILMLSILLIILVCIFSTPIYQIWIGDKVHIPFEMTILVAIYISICCWESLNGSMIGGMGKLKLSSILAMFGMILHIPLSLLLGNYIGAYGVIISLIFINFIYVFTGHIQLRKILANNATGVWNK